MNKTKRICVKFCERYGISGFYFVLLFILLFFSTFYFGYQHYEGNSWDFNAYVLNAKYWFADGNYFEMLRPPLMPFLIGIFSIGGWIFAEYFFLLFTSVCFAYGSLRLGRALKFNPVLFYGLGLNYFVLVYGLVNGTELLSVAFLLLSIALVLEESSAAGFFLALSALSRYTGLVYFPILFFQRNLKKVVLNLFLFGGTFSPWLAYNFFKTGNFFTSIADQYANNILYRGYLYSFEYVKVLSDFFKAANFLILFVIVGLLMVLFSIFYRFVFLKRWNFENALNFFYSNRVDLIFLFLFLHCIYSYIGIPLKNVRYLFGLVVPFMFFAYRGVVFFSELFDEKFGYRRGVLFCILFVVVADFGYLFVSESLGRIYHEKPYIFMDAINNIGKIDGNKRCLVRSNVWVLTSYLGLDSIPSPNAEFVNESIDEGYRILLFYSTRNPEYGQDKKFLSSFPVLYESPAYVVLGRDDVCKPVEVHDTTYVSRTHDIVFKKTGEHLNINPCFLLFRNFGFAERTCNFFNFNGFVLDENRALPRR